MLSWVHYTHVSCHYHKSLVLLCNFNYFDLKQLTIFSPIIWSHVAVSKWFYQPLLSHKQNTAMANVMLSLYLVIAQPNHMRKRYTLRYRINCSLRSAWKTLSCVGTNPGRPTNLLDNLSNMKECCRDFSHCILKAEYSAQKRKHGRFHFHFS